MIEYIALFFKLNVPLLLMLTWQDFLTLDILNLDSSKPELYLIKLHCCILGIQGSYDYILLNSYEILLLTGTFWWVRRWACSYVKTISLSTKQRYSGSGCFSVARGMLLSSLILLSDQILSFGVKNIHVIICSNLSFNDHISYVAFLHSVIWVPPWAVRLLPSQEGTDLLIKGDYFLSILLCLPGSLPTGHQHLQIDLYYLGQNVILIPVSSPVGLLQNSNYSCLSFPFL